MNDTKIIVKMLEITKSFPGVMALENVDFSIGVLDSFDKIINSALVD